MGPAAGKRPLASLPPILPAPASAGSDSLLVNGRSSRGVADPLKAAVHAEDQHLAEVEALYRAADAGLALLDRDLRYVRLNQRLAAMNGAPPEAHLGRTVREMVPALADEIERSLGLCVATGEPVVGGLIDGQTALGPGRAQLDLRCRPDQAPRRVSPKCLGRRSRDRSPRPEETLANARLAAIVESADEAIASKTLDGIVTSWNPRPRHCSVTLPPKSSAATSRFWRRPAARTKCPRSWSASAAAKKSNATRPCDDARTAVWSTSP